MAKNKLFVTFVVFFHFFLREGEGQVPAASSTATATASVTAGGEHISSFTGSITKQSGSATVTFTNSTIDLLLPEYNTLMKYRMSLYYDALDSASQAFLNSSFAETYDMFRPLIDFQFNPCQNAQIHDGQLYCTNSQDIRCFINKLHSCAIAQASDQQASAKFIICTMQNFLSSFPKFSDCASACNLNYVNLEACANSYIGAKLCLDYRGKRNPSGCSLPRFKFVHEEPKLNEQNKFLENIDTANHYKQIVCSNLKVNKVSEIPEKCDAVGCNSFVSKNGDKKLTCTKDDDDHCFVGKLHSCAINSIKDQLQLMNFFACDAQTPDKKIDFAKCAGDLKIDFEALKKCADSDLGTELCTKNAANAPPAPKTAQIFMFNWAFSERLNEEVLSKGPELIFCQQLRNYNMTTPETCNKLRLRMAIYYDALDLSFQDWFMNTITKYYDVFYPFIDFDYVPCRSVTVTDGNAEVKCHGFASNCDSDRVQSCAARQITKPGQLFKFLSCSMQTHEKSMAIFENCAQLCGIDFKMIKDCATGDMGKNICIENMQNSPESDQNFLVEFDNKFGADDSKGAVKDLRERMCWHLFHKKLAFPNECLF